MAITNLTHYAAIKQYATDAHGDQKRKYTNDPYIVHPVAVADIVWENGGDPAMVYAALLHDVIEDTPVTADQLFIDLHGLGLSQEMLFDVHELVVALTDTYTKDRFPSMNRRTRKDLEATRLGRTSERAQTIKYADLLDNTSSIVQHDPGFAKVYLKEKSIILDKMQSGDKILFMECLKSLNRNSHLVG